MAYLAAGWDFARLSTTFSVDVAESGGGSGTLTRTTGTYCHTDLQSVMGSGSYDDFAGWLKSALDAISGRTYTVTFNTATGTYSINCSFPFTLTFNNTASRQLLGFAGDSGPLAFHTSTIASTYYLLLARDGIADYTREYEVGGQTQRAVSTNATAYSIGPMTYEKRMKFTMRFNTLARTFESQAASSAPWTYQDLIEHVRAIEPVLLAYTGESIVYKYVKPEFDDGSRKPVWNDYHALWDLPVEVQFLARL